MDPRAVLAPRGRRFLAYLIDEAVLAAVVTLLALLLGSALDGDALAAAEVVVALLLSAVIWVLLPARSGARNGQGIGAQLMGIRLVNARSDDGSEVTFGQAAVHGAPYVLLGGLWGIIDGLFVLIDPHRQSYSDGLAQTYVFRADADRGYAPVLLVQGLPLPEQISLP